MSAVPRIHPVETLIVEEGPVDVHMTREAFKEARITNRIAVIADGQEVGECLGSIDFDEFMTVVKRMRDFWPSSVSLPDT